jgi:hypothetical protein
VECPPFVGIPEDPNNNLVESTKVGFIRFSAILFDVNVHPLTFRKSRRLRSLWNAKQFTSVLRTKYIWMKQPYELPDGLQYLSMSCDLTTTTFMAHPP